MRDRKKPAAGSHGSCFTIEDLYRYVASPPDAGRLRDLESHLAGCESCRQELAEVLRLIHPESEDAAENLPPLSEGEIAQTIAMIQNVASKEGQQRRFGRWAHWAAGVAAAAILLAAGAGLVYEYNNRKTNQYLAQAKLSLEEVYSARSPNGLRLDLPFSPAATIRAATPDASLKNARTFFDNALGNDGNSTQAHLGLAAVALGESQFAEAKREFQRVLDIQRNQFQALLGRGVAQYEEALQAEDPVQRRNLLNGALADFTAVIEQRPKSSEARYNRVWALYQFGRHQEALAEIGKYLSDDPDSRWAVKLKELQTQIKMLSPQAVTREVNRAARDRDAAELELLARVAPEQVPIAIRSALKRSLTAAGKGAAAGEPGTEDLEWAAGIMEAAYSITNGDHSWAALLRFYAGLSPPQRAQKKDLDAKMDAAIALSHNGLVPAALRLSAPLEPGFSRLQDYWQLFNLHHLRGNCFFYQADFRGAEAEYREMLRLSESTGAPELQAKALAALAVAYNTQTRPDAAAVCIDRLREIALRFSLDSWKAAADSASGSMHRQVNQLAESVRDFSAVLRYAYRTRNEDLLETSLDSLFFLMDRLGRIEDAKSICAEAVEAMEALKSETGKSNDAGIVASSINLLYRQGDFAFRMGDLGQAESIFIKALSSPMGDFYELESRIRLGLAQVYINRRQFADAKPLLDRSLALALSGGYNEIEWRSYFLLGETYKENHEAEAALAAFNHSLGALERTRAHIKSVDLRQQFLTRRFDPYKELVSMYHSLGDDAQAFAVTQRAKSMTLRESLAGRSDTFAFGADSSLPALPALFVDYFVTTDTLLAFISGSKVNTVVALPCIASDLEREVKAYLDSIRSGDETSFETLSRKLYDQLVDPVLRAAGNESKEMLLIFPDGPLHLLPFGGLKDREGRFLLERYELSYAPSRNVLGHCLALGRGKADTGNRRVLLLDGTANLPGAGDELAALLKLYGRNARLVSSRILPSAARLASDAEIVHFAGHAAMAAGKPALLLEPSPHLVALDSSEIATWRLLNNRLVTLAGCETGAGPLAEGETPWGLIPAFLNAGAPAVLVSLLPVDDAATGKLIASFYGLLAKGSASKSAALQQAQLQLLKSARNSGHLNPSSWVPYVLVGDPR